MHPRGPSRRVPIPVRIPGRGAWRPARTSALESPAPADASHVAPETQTIDAAYALTRMEAGVLCGAVAVAGTKSRGAAEPLAPAGVPTTRGRWSLSPDALRTGIEAMVGLGTDDGSVEVLRLPGALRSPEMWHVRLVGVRPAVAEQVAAAVRRAQGREESDVR